MFFKIETTIYNEKFMQYFLKKYKLNCLSIINKNKLHKIDQFINALPKYKNKFKKHISCIDVLWTGVFNLKVRHIGDQYTFYIDTNAFLPQTNIKIAELCDLINFGNLSLMPYPIFTDTFNKMKKNINMYYNLYILNGGK